MNYSTRETWLPIPGYEGFYEVSDHGRVRSLDHVKIDAMGRRRPFIGKVLSPALTQGYPMVTLKVAGKNRSWRVHRLVAMAFLPPPQPGQTDVCHNDGNRLNATLRNLRWDTHRGNQRDMLAHGTNNFANRPRMMQCAKGHEFIPENTIIGSDGYRRCLTCNRENRRSYRRANLQAMRKYDREWKAARKRREKQEQE